MKINNNYFDRSFMRIRIMHVKHLAQRLLMSNKSTWELRGRGQQEVVEVLHLSVFWTSVNSVFGYNHMFHSTEQYSNLVIVRLIKRINSQSQQNIRHLNSTVCSI